MFFFLGTAISRRKATLANSLSAEVPILRGISLSHEKRTRLKIPEFFFVKIGIIYRGYSKALRGRFPNLWDRDGVFFGT